MEGDSTAHLLRPDTAAGPPVVRHQALVSRDSRECLDSVLAFAEDGVAAGAAVSLGLSASLGRRASRALGRHPRLGYLDMTQLGRNPGRIIAAMLDFAAAHDGAPLRFVSEPPWAGRSAAERAETARHESLIERALAGSGATVLCVYDAGSLDAAAVSCAGLLHPVLVSGGVARPSRRYAGPAVIPPECDVPLAAPPPGASVLGYRDDLRAVRAMVLACAAEAGLPDGRAADLVLAVSEVAANTLRHTSGSGVLRIWHGPRDPGPQNPGPQNPGPQNPGPQNPGPSDREPRDAGSRDPGPEDPRAREIVCEITDSGQIADPLAGRRRPPAVPFGQGGLWVVNQVCDLVQLRSGPGGTTVRMHVRIGRG